MTTHTPGPWYVEYDGPSLPIIVTKMKIIAHIKEDNHEANARLIAAAPDLLAALEDWTEFAETKSTVDFTNKGPTSQHCYDKARAAIAKATDEKIA